MRGEMLKDIEVRSSVYLRPDKLKKQEERILVLKTALAGAWHHMENDEKAKALVELKPGTELTLYREPDNKYDEWAIAVYLGENDRIGFVTRFKNETVARLMDAGRKFIAIADAPEDEEIMAKKDVFELNFGKDRPAPTENTKYPFSIYMVEEK